MEMVPIGAVGGAGPSQDDGSATSFFAIPAPKAERSKALTPPSGPPTSLPPPPVGASSMQDQPAYLPPGAQRGVALPPPPPVQPSISGPVAYQPGQANASPFQVTAAAPPPAADAGQRVQSNRVYAIILAVMVLAAMAVVTAIWFRPDKPDTTTPTTVAAVTTTQPTVTPTKPRDTGEVAPKVKAAPATPKKATGVVKAPPPPPPSSGPGTVSVRITDASPITAVEVVCPQSGFRLRGTVTGGRASIPGVPRESCTLFFKGYPGQFGPVTGGQSLSCHMQQSTAVCQ